IGVYSVGIGLGASISAGMSIPLQQLFFGSWKWSLAAWSGLALIALLFWHYAMKRTAAANDVAPAEKEARLPWTNKRAWVLLAFFGLQSALFYSTAAWFAPIVQEAGMSRFESGTLVLFFALVQMLFGLVIPLLMNVYPARRPWMVGCCLAVLLGLVWLGLFPGHWVWAQAFVVGIGLGGLFPIGLMLPLDETSSPQEAGAWTAMMQTGGYLISCLAPVLTGYLRDVTGGYGYSFVFWIVLSVALLAIALGYGNKQGR
ncbi:MAG: CynX/NimT family MFS transporter, partial [Clostridia bacterium]